MAFQTGTGLEIRKDGLYAVLLKTSIGGMKIAAKETRSFDPGLETDEKARIADEFLKGFLKKNSASSAPVFVAVPTEWAVYRYVEMPLVVKENLRESLLYEMEKHVPFSPEDIWYDYGVIKEDNEAGTIRIHLTALRKAAMMPFFGFQGGPRRAIFGLETTSSALANYLLWVRGPKADRPSIFFYLRKEILEIQIMDGNTLLFARSVSSIDANLYEVLSRELKTAREASGVSDRELDAFFLGDNEMAEALRRLKDEGEVADIRDAADPTVDIELAPAYGLAMRGVRKVPLDCNLLPKEMRKKASKAGLYSMYALLLLLILSGAAWGAGYMVTQRAELRRLNLELKGLAAEAAMVQKIRDEASSLEARLTYLEDLRARRGSVVELLRELTDRIPKSAWISNMTISDKGVEIEGYADSASELIPLLDRSPMFKDVGFLSSITKSREGKERFRIGLKLAAPAQDTKQDEKAEKPASAKKKG